MVQNDCADPAEAPLAAYVDGGYLASTQAQSFRLSGNYYPSMDTDYIQGLAGSPTAGFLDGEELDIVTEGGFVFSFRVYS